MNSQICKRNIALSFKRGAINFYSVYDPQIYKGDPRTCPIFIPVWGSNSGSSGFFQDQNNCDTLGAYLLRSEHEDKLAWNATRPVKIVDAFCLRLFPRVRSAKTQIPPISAPRLSTPLRGLGSPLYIICGMISSWQWQQCEEVFFFFNFIHPVLGELKKKKKKTSSHCCQVLISEYEHLN